MKNSNRFAVLVALVIALVCGPRAALGSESQGDDAKVEKLAAYVLTAMQQWSPPRVHRERDEAEVVALYFKLAHEIASVVSDPSESPLFANDDTRARTALLLASVELHESGFKPYVVDGSCNDQVWRRAHRDMVMPGGVAACDGGHAFSGFQIHPSHGRGFIKLVGDGFSYGPDGIRGADLAKDGALAARVALHMLRTSVKRNNNLAWYTGEIGRSHPKADARMNVATSYAAAHPFTP